MKTILGAWAPCILFGLVSCDQQSANWSPRDGDRVGAVEIRYAGPTVIDEVRLTNFLKLTTGSIYTAEAVDKDIRALYESGYVEDVRVLAEPVDNDVRLVFEVATRPPPGPMPFVGNTAFSDYRLAHELGFGDVTKVEDMTEERIKENAVRIEDFYRREGYADASVIVRAFDGGPATTEDFQFIIEEGVLKPRP